MIAKLRHSLVKIRVYDPGKGKSEMTGSSSYAVVGSLDGERVRLSLGTDVERTAMRRIEAIKRACDSPESAFWMELEEILPARTFQFFANKVGYTKLKAQTTGKTWGDLVKLYEADLDRRIANGKMLKNTRDLYWKTVRKFTDF